MQAAMDRAAGFHALRVARVQRETDEAVTLTFDVPADLVARFAYRPGQYLTLRAVIDGQDVRRAYSICSGLDDAAPMVAVKRVAGGVFSGWANAALREGDTMDVMPPAGRFGAPIEAGVGRTYLGVAAGSGITPVLSVLKTVLTRSPGSRFVLAYGSRTTAAILFRDTLEALKDRFMGRLSVLHVLSREQQDIPVLNGRIDGGRVAALLAGLMPGGLPDHALLCGPGGMIQSVGQALAAAGMPEASVVSERFVADGAVPSRVRPEVVRGAAPFAVATVVADGARTEVPMHDGESVLEAALRAGLDLPYSCRGGMCCTCRARVTEGAVTMAVNYGLEPWETAAGYVLTCQSHPTTARVTVDYDHV